MASEHKKESMEEEEHKSEATGMMRWLLTYADMITLLLGVFIILAATSAQSVAKFQIIAEQAARVFGAGQSIMNTGAGKGMPGGTGVMPFMPKPPGEEGKGKMPEGVVVTTTSMGTLITISSGILFGSGSAELKQEAKKIIDLIHNGYFAKTNNDVLINGHTDDRPISTAVFPSNWELSTGRAGAVARYLITRWKMPQARLTIAGYADMQPIAPNDTEQNRAKNRRVEIWLLGREATRVMNKIEEAGQKAQQDLLGGGGF